MKARIAMKGVAGDLDYYNRHTQVRGLSLPARRMWRQSARALNSTATPRQRYECAHNVCSECAHNACFKCVHNVCVQIEAVFNRGLKIDRNGFKRGDAEMTLDVAGDSGRIKSFLRWCQRGPPLARAEEVKITWSK